MKLQYFFLVTGLLLCSAVSLFSAEQPDGHYEVINHAGKKNFIPLLSCTEAIEDIIQRAELSTNKGEDIEIYETRCIKRKGEPTIDAQRRLLQDRALICKSFQNPRSKNAASKINNTKASQKFPPIKTHRMR
jgi:hypothetical protein